MKIYSFYNVSVYGTEDRVVCSSTFEVKEEAEKLYNSFLRKYKYYTVELVRFDAFLEKGCGENRYSDLNKRGIAYV